MDLVLNLVIKVKIERNIRGMSNLKKTADFLPIVDKNFKYKCRRISGMLDSTNLNQLSEIFT